MTMYFGDIMNKKGISLIIAVMAITVMSIIISAASVVGSSVITSANFDEFISQINRVSDNVNEYYISNNELPITGEIVALESLGNHFIKSVVENGDEGQNLLVIDMNKIKDSTIKNGIGKTISKDVFVVSEISHNVYYLKGFKYKDKLYFCD